MEERINEKKGGKKEFTAGHTNEERNNKNSDNLEWIIISIFLIIFFVVSFTGWLNKSATIDEVAHLPAGYTYLTKFDYRLNIEHPPLVKMLSAAPLLFLHLNTPSNTTLFEQSYEWLYGADFLYNTGNDADLLLIIGKIPLILLAMVGSLFTYLWARELYGKIAGLFALFLFVFCPNILAHAGVIQTDIGTTTFMVITFYFFWKFLKNDYKEKKYLVFTGIALGLGLATKFTALFFIPIMLILLGLKIYFNPALEPDTLNHAIEPDTVNHAIKPDTGKVSIISKITSKVFKKETLKQGVYFIVILIIGFLILLSAYGFKNFPYYLKGLDSVMTHSTSGHPSFLMGEHSNQGWWYYFIIAFLIKTPIPLLIMMFFAVIFATKRLLSKRFADEYFLLIPATIYFIAFMMNNINIGVRHILPVYPFLFIIISGLLTLKLKPDIANKMLKLLIALLSLWYLLGAILIYPHYLAYFNEFVGADNGYKYLIDSNIDWGQDMKGVSKWVYENNLQGSEIILAYIGNEPLGYRGLNFTQATCYPVEGITIVSVNALQDIANTNNKCLDWLKQYSPKKKIGYSIFIYNITDQRIDNYQKICETECQKICLAQKKQNKASIGDLFREKCLCDCV